MWVLPAYTIQDGLKNFPVKCDGQSYKPNEKNLSLLKKFWSQETVELISPYLVRDEDTLNQWNTVYEALLRKAKKLMLKSINLILAQVATVTLPTYSS